SPLAPASGERGAGVGKEAAGAGQHPPEDQRLPCMSTLLAHQVAVCTHTGASLASNYPRLSAYLRQRGAVALSRHPAWLTVLRDGLGHVPYCLEAVAGGQTCGVLPLAFVRSWLFGRFLVSLPYLNSAGVVADDPSAARCLIAEAVRLADRLRVKYLEL